jgi:hypothetical protein
MILLISLKSIQIYLYMTLPVALKVIDGVSHFLFQVLLYLSFKMHFSKNQIRALIFVVIIRCIFGGDIKSNYDNFYFCEKIH